MTLTRLVARQAAVAPAQDAIIYRDARVSFRALDRLSRKLARSFARLGVRAGDRIAIWLPNVPAWHVCLLACARLGAVAVAINTRFRSAELAQILGRSEPRLMVLWPDFRGIDFVPVLHDCEKQALSSVRAFITYSETPLPVEKCILGRDTYGFERLLTGPATDSDAAEPDAGCVIFTTSGTTSAPKLAWHTQRSIAAHAHDTVRAYGYDATDAVILVATPMCGTSGFGIAVAALAAGRPQVVAPVFDEFEIADLAREHKITHTHATHHIIRRLLDAVPEERPFPSMRLVNCGSGAASMVEEAAARGMCVIGIYGSTEVQARFSRQSELLPPLERAVGGGMPISADAIVRARCVETGVILPPDADGEIEIRAPSQFAGYLADAELNRRAFTPDGFVRTGDLGHTLPDGRFVFVSRMGDMLRLSGFLVSPQQIEHVIEQHPAVRSCQVVGVDTEAGLRPFAFIQTAAGCPVDEARLLSYCRDKMAPFKCPVAVDFIGEFPVTHGPNQTKVQKARLRDMARSILRARTPGSA